MSRIINPMFDSNVATNSAASTAMSILSFFSIRNSDMMRPLSLSETHVMLGLSAIHEIVCIGGTGHLFIPGRLE